MRVSRVDFVFSLKDSMDYKALFREGFLRTDLVWNDCCDHPRTLPEAKPPEIPRIYPENASSVSGLLATAGIYFASMAGA
jgi:hypothetical protein